MVLVQFPMSTGRFLKSVHARQLDVKWRRPDQPSQTFKGLSAWNSIVGDQAHARRNLRYWLDAVGVSDPAAFFDQLQRLADTPAADEHECCIESLRGEFASLCDYVVTS